MWQAQANASRGGKNKPQGVSNPVFRSKHEDGSTAGLLIDAIQTQAMQDARDANQTAFALLKSIDGTPSLVKIIELPNNKQVKPFLKLLLYRIN